MLLAMTTTHDRHGVRSVVKRSCSRDPVVVGDGAAVAARGLKKLTLSYYFHSLLPGAGDQPKNRSWRILSQPARR